MASTIDIGIDLGTTNSSIALCRDGEVSIIQSPDQSGITPSVVYVGADQRMLVGKKAYDIWVQDPENTQAEFKRWMGYSDKLSFPASGRQLSAEELSAEILKSLRHDAEEKLARRISSAVITVPAAFGSLQCDATLRAARLAGFEQSPLLQEPIAAAIAYGATPASRNQRWMVFDLGGGTLDIAIVSTRNDRLAVLEHQGNNRLGGKDLDRLISQAFFLAPLSQMFDLPDGKTAAPAYNRLMRALVRRAEEAKIELSDTEEVIVEIFGVGQDRAGREITASLTIRRDEMERVVQPVLDQCMDLARRALQGARISSSELDRVLLVGGPTKMPVLRAALHDALNVKLDHSLDPLSVVAHGAALFASTQENPLASPQSAPPPARSGNAIPIQLAYERASGTPQSPVAGIVDPSAGVHEAKIESDGGFWTSGWMPVLNGCFQVDVMLHDGRPVTQFSLAARDRAGRAVAVDPAKFSITYMLPMSAAPLPHTIAIELSTLHGVTTFDPIFRRHSPLPAEARKTYRAERALRPSEADGTLPIKFWEIEVSDDPTERWWAGCVQVRADRIKRPILEGTEMELTVRIDASRKMSVELFIPLLNQGFSDDVYLPDPPSARSQLQQQLDLCFDRLNHVRFEVYDADREDLIPIVQNLQLRAESIAEQAQEDLARGNTDPDAALAPTEMLRKLRLQLTQVEEQLEIGGTTITFARRMRGQVRYIERMVQEHGTSTEKADFEKLSAQYQRYAQSDDGRGLKWVQEQLWELHWNVVNDQAWYWQNRLESLKAPGKRFLNREQAGRCIQDGELAVARNDLPALRNAVFRAWSLMPPDQLENAKQQEAHSGLRAT